MVHQLDSIEHLKRIGPKERLAGIVCVERKVRRGEDATPFSLTNRVNTVGFLVVADGLGGAGNQRLERLAGLTGARAAAELAIGSFARHAIDIVNGMIAACEDRFVSGPRPQPATAPNLRAAAPPDPPLAKFELGNLIGPIHVDGLVRNFQVTKLSRYLDQRFTNFLAQTRAEKSLVRSRMARVLPTTFSALVFERFADNYSILSIWAGDSRGYALTPAGLSLLTRDHKEHYEPAPENHIFDVPMSNYICEVTPNRLEAITFVLEGPALIFVCTDGVYEMGPTAAALETFLLRTLATSSSMGEFCMALKTQFERSAGDDCSIAFNFLGVDSFEQAKAMLLARPECLETTQPRLEPQAVTYTRYLRAADPVDTGHSSRAASPDDPHRPTAAS